MRLFSIKHGCDNPNSQHCINGFWAFRRPESDRESQIASANILRRLNLVKQKSSKSHKKTPVRARDREYSPERQHRWGHSRDANFFRCPSILAFYFYKYFYYYMKLFIMGFLFWKVLYSFFYFFEHLHKSSFCVSLWSSFRCFVRGSWFIGAIYLKLGLYYYTLVLKNA